MPTISIADNKVGWADVGPTFGRQAWRWPSIGPTNLDIWDPDGTDYTYWDSFTLIYCQFFGFVEGHCWTSVHLHTTVYWKELVDDYRWNVVR